jgi:aldehyde dehydrogenase (NAD+)
LFKQVQASVYDEFQKRLIARAKAVKLGDPFSEGIDKGPQVSQVQYDRIMRYIQSGREQGGMEGNFINPTIFADVKPNMKIILEEIFGPVGVVIKFETEPEEGSESFLTASDTGVNHFCPRGDQES